MKPFHYGGCYSTTLSSLQTLYIARVYFHQPLGLGILEKSWLNITAFMGTFFYIDVHHSICLGVWKITCLIIQSMVIILDYIVMISVMRYQTETVIVNGQEIVHHDSQYLKTKPKNTGSHWRYTTHSDILPSFVTNPTLSLSEILLVSPLHLHISYFQYDVSDSLQMTKDARPFSLSLCLRCSVSTV